MAYLKFNKDELVNLEYSLKREVLATNRGATQSASLITSAIIRDKACRLGGGCGTETSMMYAPLPDITL